MHIVRAMYSPELIRAIRKNGWELIRVTGSHHHFQHVVKQGIFTIPRPKNELVQRHGEQHPRRGGPVVIIHLGNRLSNALPHRHPQGPWKLLRRNRAGAARMPLGGRHVRRSMLMAKEAICDHLEAMRDAGLDVPTPLKLERHKANRAYRRAYACAIVEVDTDDLPGKAVRLSITMNDRILSVSTLSPASTARPAPGCFRKLPVITSEEIDNTNHDPSFIDLYDLVHTLTCNHRSSCCAAFTRNISLGTYGDMTMDSWMPVIGALLGALIGAGVPAITTIVQLRASRRVERMRWVLDAALHEHRTVHELNLNGKSSPDEKIAPLSVYVSYYTRLSDLVESDKCDPTHLTALHKAHDQVVSFYRKHSDWPDQS